MERTPFQGKKKTIPLVLKLEYYVFKLSFTNEMIESEIKSVNYFLLSKLLLAVYISNHSSLYMHAFQTTLNVCCLPSLTLRL